MRGEVWWAELAPRSGSEQRGRRPVVVVSSDALNAVARWRSVVVVPLSTSERPQRAGPTAVAIPARAAQLPSASVALCHQITPLVEPLGVLPAGLLREVERGINAALDRGGVVTWRRTRSIPVLLEPCRARGQCHRNDRAQAR